MKLACLRCKEKKLKCDRSDPVCNRCIAANADCLPVERRKRPRLAQQKVAVQHLNNRLESLERRLNPEAQGSPSSMSTTPEGIASVDITPASLPNPSLTTENGTDSWIYRMAADARKRFEQANSQCQSPTITPTPHIDDAMSALNDALDDLAKLKVRTGSGEPVHRLKLTPTEHRESIDMFISVFGTAAVPDVLRKCLDLDLLRALPDVVCSSYVNLNPALHVLYYICLHYGLAQLNGPGDARAEAAYQTALDGVPAWLDSGNETDLDGFTATLCAWAAINNLDYQLSWKFHCKSCHFIKKRGIDRLDTIPAKTLEEETKREAYRALFWHVLNTDCAFRLFFGKTSVLQYSQGKIKPPDVVTTWNMRPMAAHVTICVVWIHSTSIMAEAINLIDNHPVSDRNPEFHEKVNQFCRDLEEITVDWNLDSIIESDRWPVDLCYVMVDLIMIIHATVIGMKRLVLPRDRDSPADPTSLRSARKLMRLILKYAGPMFTNETTRSGFVHFMSFYPFCAVFSLYEHVLASTDPNDYEGDLQSLEQLGAAMVQISSLRTDFITLARTITALNTVSRTYQNNRKTASSQASGIILNSTPTSNSRPQTPNVMGIPPSTFDPLQGLLTPSMQSSYPDLPAIPELAMDESFQPLNFVRALENDFLGGNWRESWWTIGDDGDADMTT